MLIYIYIYIAVLKYVMGNFGNHEWFFRFFRERQKRQHLLQNDLRNYWKPASPYVITQVHNFVGVGISSSILSLDFLFFCNYLLLLFYVVKTPNSLLLSLSVNSSGHTPSGQVKIYYNPIIVCVLRTIFEDEFCIYV